MVAVPSLIVRRGRGLRNGAESVSLIAVGMSVGSQAVGLIGSFALPGGGRGPVRVSGLFGVHWLAVHRRRLLRMDLFPHATNVDLVPSHDGLSCHAQEFAYRDVDGPLAGAFRKGIIHRASSS